MDEKLKGEDALRASGMPYTIVRPGGLANQPAGTAKLTWSAITCFGSSALWPCRRLYSCIGASKRVTIPRVRLRMHWARFGLMQQVCNVYCLGDCV